jgi:hypothetical protein
MTILLYHIPQRIREQAEPSYQCFRPLSDAMVDYVLFEPRVWRDVRVDGTLSEFLSTAMYQIVRRVRTDPSIDNGTYPSFEMDWRSTFATRLRDTLEIPPDALCPSIHRVIPIGVSSSDAMNAMTVAIPKDVQDPYAITVQAFAVDDRCGSIAITQPMQYSVININCTIDPGILVDVCRELRSGHKAVAAEVHSIRRELSTMREENFTMREETNQKLSIMTTLVTRLMKGDKDIAAGGPVRCTKTGCQHVVTKRFRSGKRQKQCTSCLSHTVKSIAKGKVKLSLVLS